MSRLGPSPGATWKLDGKTNLVAAVGRRGREGAADYIAFNAGVTRTLFKGRLGRAAITTAPGAGSATVPGELVGALRAKF